MKIKYVVMRDNDREVERFDKEEDAVKRIERCFKAGIMGSQEFYIKKVWTDRK